METTEVWAPVMGFEDFYEVSNLGGVRSLPRVLSDGRRMKGKNLSCTIDARGYPTVHLSINSIRFPRRVHRIMLQAFTKKLGDGLDACHNNGIRHDNRLSNVRWGTRSENIKESYVHGRKPSPSNPERGEKRYNAVLNNDKVLTIFKLFRSGMSQADISRKLGVSKNAVNCVVLRKTWAHVQISEDA